MPIQQISETREQIVSTIRKVADTQNADFRFLLNQAKVESGLDPRAKASTSSATGLFQFTAGTWLNMVKLHGDQVGLAAQAQDIRSNTLSAADRARILDMRNDPQAATALAARLAADNAQALAASGHKSIGPTELYLAHFLGASGANAFLTGLRDRPSEPAANALPAAAAANTGVFFANRTPQSFQAIYDRFAQKFADASKTLAATSPKPAETGFAVLDNATSFETRLKEIVATAISASRLAATPDSAEASAAAPVTENAMQQYLKGFSLVDHASGMTQMGDGHARDASQAAVGTGEHAPISAQSVSPLAAGARLILKATGPE